MKLTKVIKMLQKNDPCDKMRKKIISICYQLGWIYNGNDDDKKMNMAKIDAFLKSRGYIKKPLNQYTKSELPKLVSQFQQIARNNDRTKAGKVLNSILDDLGIKIKQ